MNNKSEDKPSIIDFDSYYMLLALAVRARANCKGRKVGAVIVKNNRIISTGYNGTPEGMTNCDAGGCIRCTEYRDSGELYDKCICVHAEQNAMVTAARFGHSIENSVIYSTLKPCFSCLKELLQAQVITIYYLEEISTKKAKSKKDRAFLEQYNILINRFKKIPQQISPNILSNIDNMKDYLQSLNAK